MAITQDITAGLEDYAGGAATQNLGAAGKNQELADLINTVNATAQQKLNDAQLGATGVAARNQQLENINRSAQGYLGEDYVRQMQNRYAGEAGNSGMGVDSSNWNAALERTLGLETKKIQDESITQLGDWAKTNPAAKLYGMESGNIGASDYASALNAQRTNERLQEEYGQTLALDYQKLAEQKRASEATLEEEIRQANLTKYTTTIGPEWDRKVTTGNKSARNTPYWGNTWGNTPNGLYPITRLNNIV
jgi:hypothetical protein